MLDLALEYWKTLGVKSSHEKFKLSILGFGIWNSVWIRYVCECVGIGFFFIKTKQSEIKYADCTSSSVAMDFFPSGLKLKFTQLTVWHVQGEVRREGRGGVEMFLRNIHEGSDEHLVEDSVVEGPVFETFVTLSVPEGGRCRGWSDPGTWR